jgi:hypothetical protein
MEGDEYSTIEEAKRLFDLLLSAVTLPPEIEQLRETVTFKASRQQPYFPIPFKETEVGAALKAIEGCVVSALAGGRQQITVDLQKTTAFMFQTYLATVDGYGKLDAECKRYLKGLYDIPTSTRD